MIIKTGLILAVVCGVAMQSLVASAQTDVPVPNAPPTALMSQHSIDLSLVEAVSLGLRRN